MRTICLLLSLLVLAGCSRDTPPTPNNNQPAPGGGSHRLTNILLLDRENSTLLKEKNRQTLHVGERMPLQVMASWAIPYVGDVTDRATLSVSDPTIGDLDEHAVFTARKPGKVVIEATVQAAGDEVLERGASPPVGSTPVVFKDRIELTISD